LKGRPKRDPSLSSKDDGIDRGPNDYFFFFSTGVVVLAFEDLLHLGGVSRMAGGQLLFLDLVAVGSLG